MYLLRCLLFSLLVINAFGNITIDDDAYKTITDTFTGPSCACSNFTINKEYKCDDTAKELAKLTTDLDNFCESFGKSVPTKAAGTKKKVEPAKTIEMLPCQCGFFKKNDTMILNCTISNKLLKMNAPPATIEMVNSLCQNFTWDNLPRPNNTTKPQNDTDIEALPTFLCTKDKKQCFSQKHLDKVTVPVKSIEDLGCRFDTVELNNRVTLNCTISNKALEINLPLETRNMLNSFCQKLTWANLPQLNYTKNENDTDIEALPTFLCTKDKKQCFSQKHLDNVTVPVKSIEDLGCRFNSVEKNNTVTLNCTISNKALKINPPLETRNMLNSLCQKLTWAHLPQPNNTKIESDTDETMFLCTTNQKYCFPLHVLGEMVDAVTRLCVCSNVTVGEVKSECTYRQKLDEQKLKNIDSMCTSLKNLTTQLDKVIQNIPVTETPPSNIQTNNNTGFFCGNSTEKPKNNATDPPVNPNNNATDPPVNPKNNASDPPVNPKNNATDPPVNPKNNATDPPVNPKNNATDPPVNPKNNATDPPVNPKNNATDPPVNPKNNAIDSAENPSKNDTGKFEKYVASPTEAGSQYSTGTVVAIGFCAFVVGTLIAVAAKMSYTRYRRRTYVNQGRA